MTITGVTESVRAAMEAVQANVLCEDDLLQRTCEHGIRHPVGHLRRVLRENDRHQRASERAPLQSSWACDGCCQTWSTHVPLPERAP